MPISSTTACCPNAQNAFAANGERQAGHPFDMTLNVQSFEDEIRFFRKLGVPLKFQYRGGYGYNYDSYGLPTLGDGSATYNSPLWGGVPYSPIYQTYLGSHALHRIGGGSPSRPRSRRKSTGSNSGTPCRIIRSPPTFSTTIANTPLNVKKPAYFLSYEVLNIGDLLRRGSAPRVSRRQPTR